jgi:para-nitrobenzyl esterase
MVARTYGAAAARALSLYAPGTDARLGDVALQAATDLMFRCPAAFTAGAVSAAGGAAWLYHFDLSKAGPVSHSSELPYVFDDLPVAPGATLQAYWVDFARTGDPNGPGLPAWPRYGGERAYLQVGPEGLSVGRDLRGPICARLGRP